ncbi:MAG: hypothetical protein IJ493_04440 [Clostridia bacterium]|nr:hypothetical protein [Clostridia bacterium]
MNIIAAVKNKRAAGTVRADITAIWILSAFLLAYFLKSPRTVTASAAGALEQCAIRLIPSLFPFLVLTGIMNGSGLSALIARILGKPFSALFGLPPAGAYAFLLGSLGGFPVGAVCTRGLYERGELTLDEAGRLCAFSNNAGLAFCVGGIGLALFGDTAVGWQLYVSQLLAAALVGIAQRPRSFRHPAESTPPTESASQSAGEIVTAAVSQAGMTMLKICAFAVFFAVIGDALAMVLTVYFGEIVSALGVSFCELTMASRCCAGLGGLAGKLLCGFAVGFSGISVHMQVVSVLSGSGISATRYSVSKLVQGLLTAGILLVINLTGEIFR